MQIMKANSFFQTFWSLHIWANSPAERFGTSPANSRRYTFCSYNRKDNPFAPVSLTWLHSNNFFHVYLKEAMQLDYCVLRISAFPNFKSLRISALFCSFPLVIKILWLPLHWYIDEFQKKFSARILQRYLLHSKDIRKEQDLILLPMYMSMFL